MRAGAGGGGSPRSPGGGSGSGSGGGGGAAFSDEALEALERLEDLLAREDLLEYLELLVEQGCVAPEDLARFEEAEVKDMTTKIVHRRKLLALRRKYKEEAAALAKTSGGQAKAKSRFKFF